MKKTMKKTIVQSWRATTLAIITFTLLLTTYNFSQAQTPTWEWAYSNGVANEDWTLGIVVDNEGNSYVGGHFQNTIVYGTDTLVNLGSYDVFFVKYDTTGNVIWAKAFGGTGGDEISGIVIDENNNLYISGYFSSSSFQLGTKVLSKTTNSTGDMFVAKLDSDGNTIWAFNYGGENSNSVANDIALDSNNNIYIAGYYNSLTLLFDTIVLTKTSVEYSDCFIAKFDNNGTPIWAKGPDVSGGSERFEGITIDANNNVYAVGHFNSLEVTFGDFSVTNTSILYEIFLMKYDSNGNVIWVKQGRGYSDDVSRGAIETDGESIIIHGFFRSSTLTFETTSLSLIPSNDETNSTNFLAKFDYDGNLVWAKSIGCYGPENVGNFDFSDIKITENKDIIVCGAFYTSSFSPGGGFTITNTSPYGGYHTYLIEYSPDGDVLWADGIGGEWFVGSGHLALDKNDDLYLAGIYLINNFMLDSIEVSYDGDDWDMFVAKLSGLPKSLSTEINNKEKSFVTNEISIYPNPSNGKFAIEIGSVVERSRNAETIIKIYTIDGKMVYNDSIDAQTRHASSLQLTDFNKGMYFIKIETENNIYTKKIIIN